jgi:hypothetical protein
MMVRPFRLLDFAAQQSAPANFTATVLKRFYEAGLVGVLERPWGRVDLAEAPEEDVQYVGLLQPAVPLTGPAGEAALYLSALGHYFRAKAGFQTVCIIADDHSVKPEKWATYEMTLPPQKSELSLEPPSSPTWRSSKTPRFARVPKMAQPM